MNILIFFLTSINRSIDLSINQSNQSDNQSSSKLLTGNAKTSVSSAFPFKVSYFISTHIIHTKKKSKVGQTAYVIKQFSPIVHIN